MPEPTPLRGPRIRKTPVPDDAFVVVRGDDLEAGTTRRQALAFRARFADWGRYGISAYYARTDAEIDDLASDHLERFPELAIYSTHDLVVAGFEVVPTFRTPHVTITFTEDLDDSLSRLDDLRVDMRPNPYHDGDET